MERRSGGERLEERGGTKGKERSNGKIRKRGRRERRQEGHAIASINRKGQTSSSQ